MKNGNLNTSEMTQSQMAVYEVEAYLEEKYEFRRNVLSGKTEYKQHDCEEWTVVTEETTNSIIRRAKKDGLGNNKSPRQDIEEYMKSDAVTRFCPITEFLNTLPKWDGRNHVANLFNHIPGLTCEQLGWCATWMRSTVAHWLHEDIQHGNETVPVLIGRQGCGKSTFAYRLLPPQLRTYYLDHINFANKFDSDMALTHNLLVNIDELANMGPAQQGKLKQTLSRVKVNGRPIFGSSQDDRPRYASFIATTNDPQPLCDPTGSRRYICINIPDGMYIDNTTDIDYDQLYAQVVHELHVSKAPYWFGNDEVARIQQANIMYFKTQDIETMLDNCLSVPAEGNEGTWMGMSDICNILHRNYPAFTVNAGQMIKIGKILKFLGCTTKRSAGGRLYNIIPRL